MLGAVLRVPGAFAALVIVSGMLLYLAKVDQTSPKWAWSVLLFFGAPIGEVLYYFVVYRNQVAAKLISEDEFNLRTP